MNLVHYRVFNLKKVSKWFFAKTSRGLARDIWSIRNSSLKIQHFLHVALEQPRKMWDLHVRQKSTPKINQKDFYLLLCLRLNERETHEMSNLS